MTCKTCDDNLEKKYGKISPTNLMFMDEIDKKKKKNHKNSSQPTNLATQVIHAILFNKFFMT